MILQADVKTRLRHRVADFLMIVAGVLVALAADAWWDARIERQRSGNYLDRIAAELRINVGIADTLLMHTARIQAATDTVHSLFEGSSSKVDGAALLINAYNATRRWVDEFITSTLDDMEASGNLHLIRRAALRTEL